MSYKVIDLFSGAGGLSKGFLDAGYDIKLGIDFDDKALLTFSKNHGDTEVLKLDLFDLNNVNIIKEKFEEKNIKLEVIEEKEDSYIINLKKVKRIATLSLRIPNSTRYYYIHYKQDFHRYDWYDEEYHTVSEIAEQLNIMLDRF